MYSGAIGAFQPLLVDKLGMTLTQAGLLGGVMVFSGSFVQPAYGFLSDRFHSRMFSVLAPAVAGIFISLLGLSWNFTSAAVAGVSWRRRHRVVSSAGVGVGDAGNFFESRPLDGGIHQCRYVGTRDRADIFCVDLSMGGFGTELYRGNSRRHRNDSPDHIPAPTRASGRRSAWTNRLYGTACSAKAADHSPHPGRAAIRRANCFRAVVAALFAS